MVFCYFGFFTFQAMKKKELNVPDGFNAQTAEHAAMLNIWLAMRQCEIDLFRYLEGFVNDDKSKLKTDEIKGVIKVMAYMVNIPASFQLTAHDIVSVSDTKLIKRRVRAALFVYICILNDKLPSGTNLWDLLDNGRISQLLKIEFQNCLANIDNLLSGFEFWEQSIRKNVQKSTQKIRAYSDILDAIDSSHNPLTADLEDFEDDQDFFHDEDFAQSFVGDSTEVANEIDFYITGGILDAMANESLEDLYFLSFMPLPDINWTNAFTPISQEGSQEINEDSLQRLAIRVLLISRFSKAYLAKECLDLLSSTEVTLPDLVQKAYSRVDGLLAHLSSCFPGIKNEQVLSLISALNEGYRWMELIEIIECLEILLTQRSFISLFALGTPLQRFDIGEIVSNGTEDDFRHLKELLSTSFSWLKKPCSELRGFVELFLRAEYLMALGDLTSAQEIGCQLQKLVVGSFGDPEHVKLTIHRFFDKYNGVIRNPIEDMISKLPSSEDMLSLASDFEIALPTSKEASLFESSSSNAQNVEEKTFQSDSEFGQSLLPFKAMIQYILREEYSECGPEH
ncbi:hypothetical protein EIK77_004407 [Talaromyces pinophilus]|nr:hypothetical protein EIK77_004407 [Talaromyces pinophilus]